MTNNTQQCFSSRCNSSDPAVLFEGRVGESRALCKILCIQKVTRRRKNAEVQCSHDLFLFGFKWIFGTISLLLLLNLCNWICDIKTPTEEKKTKWARKKTRGEKYTNKQTVRIIMFIWLKHRHPVSWVQRAHRHTYTNKHWMNIGAVHVCLFHINFASS